LATSEQSATPLGSVARHGVRMRRALLIAVTVAALAGATGVILDRWVD
jgi:hypothetical protein